MVGEQALEEVDDSPRGRRVLAARRRERARDEREERAIDQRVAIDEEEPRRAGRVAAGADEKVGSVTGARREDGGMRSHARSIDPAHGAAWTARRRCARPGNSTACHEGQAVAGSGVRAARRAQTRCTLAA